MPVGRHSVPQSSRAAVSIAKAAGAAGRDYGLPEDARGTDHQCLRNLVRADMTAASDDGFRVADRRGEFADLYLRHRDRLRRYAAWMAPHVDWESAVHDAFVAAYLNWDKITISRRAWLTTTVHRNVIDLTRGREQPVDVNEAFVRLCKNTSHVQFLQRSREGEEWLEVMQTFAATQELPHYLRASVILRFEGSDDNEIAQVLGVDRATVRRYRSEGLRRIAKKVGNHDRRQAMRTRLLPRRRDNRTTTEPTETR